MYLAPRPSRRASNLASQLHLWLCNSYASPLGVVKLGVYKFFDPDWVYLDAIHPDTEGLSHPNVFFHLSEKLVSYARIRITSYLKVHCNGADVADKVNTLMHKHSVFFCFVPIFANIYWGSIPNLLTVAMQFLQANYLLTIQKVQKVHLRQGRIYISHV